MPIILFDNSKRRKLFPFTKTRAVASIRFGMFTQTERWQRISGDSVFILTEPYLQKLYEKIPAGNALIIDAALMPSFDLYERIFRLKNNAALVDEHGFIAGRKNYNNEISAPDFISTFETIINYKNAKRIEYPWQFFQWNDVMIKFDFSLIKNISEKISSTNHFIKPENIFIESGAIIEFSTLNASGGPIYISKNATVMEGAFIRGPFFLGENSTVKMGAKIYGATSIGNFCSVGGEIKNTVVQDFSNKAHDGYLGDSVIGSWCNLGAGSSNSNIKNTGGDVMMHDFFTNQKVNAGNKCGMLMGDYSRAAINSSFNTGSTIGVSCNVFGNGLLPKMIDDFAWGNEHERYDFDKAIRGINNWKKLKNREISENEIDVLKHIFDALQQNKL